MYSITKMLICVFTIFFKRLTLYIYNFSNSPTNYKIINILKNKNKNKNYKIIKNK